MRPSTRTPVHKTSLFAELVCSNSLRSDSLTNAHGLLKEEMRRLGSLTIEAALESRVPAGQALAVDREAFSRRVTERVREAPGVTVVEEEVTEIPNEGIVILATGPSDLRAALRFHPRVHRQRLPLLLRRGEPGGRSRERRLREGVSRVPLRQGRRRLHQLSSEPRGVPSLSRSAALGRDRGSERHRQRPLLRGVSSDRGHGRPRESTPFASVR